VTVSAACIRRPEGELLLSHEFGERLRLAATQLLDGVGDLVLRRQG